MMLPVDSIRSAGKFRLLTRLGSGGMGEVYLALARGPVGFQKLHVLKFLREDLTADLHADALRMFEDEARIAARLNHPNVVQCHELAFDNERPYLAMEYLDGQPLSRIQHRAQQGVTGWTLEMRLLVLAHVLDALEYAHELKDFDGSSLHVVHRDVSPDNVFVTYAGQVKLVDFGIAKTLHSTRTSTGVVKGKLRYMAPEQARGESVDARADLYAVGVMLWEAVAQAPLHEANMSPYQLMQRVAEGKVPALEQVAPLADPVLIALVSRALALRPEDRWQSATELRTELGAIMARLSRVEPRSIGSWVAAAFAVERKAVLDVIRRASAGVEDVALAATMPTMAAMPTMPTLDTDFDAPRGTRRLDAPDDTAHSRVESIAGVAPTTSSRWRQWRYRVVALAALAVSAAYALSLPRGETPSAPAATESSVASVTSPLPAGGAPTPAPEVTAPPPAAEGVAVELEALPAGARLTLNGKPVANPYLGRHAAGDVLQFVASLRGHKSQTWAPVLHEQAGNMTHTLQLEPQPRAPKAFKAVAPERARSSPYERFDLDPD